MNRDKIFMLGKTLLLAGSLLFTFLFVVMGFGNHMDPFYWMDICLHLDNNSYMIIGTSLIGHAWMYVFGASVVSMRLLSWIMTVVAIALPYICLLDEKERKDNLHWLALAYCLTGYGVFQEYSAGAVSVLLMSILVVLWTKYADNYKYVYVLPIVVAMAIWVRFPNIIVLAVLSVFMLIQGMVEHKSWLTIVRDEAILIGGAVVLLFLLYWISIPNFSMSTILDGFAQQSEGKHSMSYMMDILLQSGWTLLKDIAYVLVLGAIFYSINLLNNKWFKWGGAILLAIISLGLAKHCFDWHEWYNRALHYFISAIVLAMAIYIAGKLIKHKQWSQMLLVLAVTCICGVVPLGSDTAWLKLFPVLLCILPVFMAKYLQKEQKITIAYPTVIGFCLFAMITYCYNPVGGKSLFQGRVFSTTELYKHVFLPKCCDAYLNQLQQDYEHYNIDGNAIAVGDGSHLFEALTRCNSYTYSAFWRDIDDEAFVSFVKEEIQTSHPTVFCVHTPYFIYRDYNIGQSAMEDMLKEEGYSTIIDRSDECYMIYVY